MDSNPSTLQQIREGAGLSRAKAAELLGTTRMNLWYIENGHHSPSGPLKLLMARVYQVDEQSILKAIQ